MEVLWCRAMTVKIALSALLLLQLLVAGCASGPGALSSMQDMKIVARDERFALVRLQPGQSFRDVATAFYGYPQEEWQLREANAITTESAGQVVAVPLVPVNSSSVYPDGYRTLPILCYHQFTHRQATSHRLELTAEAFEQQIRYLTVNDYQLLSFADVAEIMRNDRPIPEKAVVITIDDGYRSIYDVAWPILQKYQARATLFIYTDFVGAGKGLTWSQIETMAASGLIEIQSHAKSHTSLSRLPTDKSQSAYRVRVQAEIDGSDAVFRKRLGTQPIYLSYPFGNSSETAADIVEASGYSLAATVTRGDNTVFSDRYLLHRTMIYDNQDLAEFSRLIRNYRGKPLQ